MNIPADIRSTCTSDGPKNHLFSDKATTDEEKLCLKVRFWVKLTDIDTSKCSSFQETFDQIIPWLQRPIEYT